MDLPELAHERLDVGELPALHLPEGGLVLHEQLRALRGVLGGRDEVLDVGLLQVLQRVDDGEQLRLQESVTCFKSTSRKCIYLKLVYQIANFTQCSDAATQTVN